MPTVQTMVGEDGSASAVQNFLIVRASAERMAQIEQLIASLDTEQKNIRISVSHDADISSTQKSIGVSGSVGGDDVQLSLPRQNGQKAVINRLQIEADQQKSLINRSGSEYLTVLDGQRAFIRVGQSVPFTQQWLYFSQHYVSAGRITQFHDITTGFAVRPRYIGSQVEVEITPRVASVDSSGYVDFEELATVVRVSPGQWFDLGGTMQTKDEVSRAILSGQQSNNDSKNSVLIKVD